MACKVTEKESILNIVLVGKTGSGKSATGNSLLNRSVFKTSDSSNSCTESCQLESAKQNETIINVIDTPGLMDTSKSPEEILKLIEEAMSLCEGGFNAFILVLRHDVRFTEEEFQTYNMIKGLFGPDFLKICIIVFARGDVFELNDSPPFELWLQDQKGMLNEIIKECNSRFVLFYNNCKRPEYMEKRQAAVSQLLKMINDNDMLYTDDNFIKAADSRKRITIEAKLPQLQAKYQMQLSLLQAEYEKASNDLSDESIQSLLNQAMKIMQSINEDANGTDVLNDFKNSISNQLHHINKLKASKNKEIKIQKLIEKTNLLKDPPSKGDIAILAVSSVFSNVVGAIVAPLSLVPLLQGKKDKALKMLKIGSSLLIAGPLVCGVGIVETVKELKEHKKRLNTLDKEIKELE